MFRHPKISDQDGTMNDFSIDKKIDQSIRYFSVPSGKDKSDVLNTLLSNIDKEAFNSAAKVRRLYVGAVSMAASIVVLIAMYFTFGIQRIDADQKAKVYFLPDQTRVVLAEGTRVSYSKIFFNRQVKLNGEAYFEVEKGDNFYVKTSNGGVLVLGTRFKVSKLNGQFQVHCYEGAVGIDYAGKKIRLDEGFLFSGVNKEFELTDKRDYGYPAFSYFNYSCKNEKLSQIWPEIESYFGVEITSLIDDEHKSFSGSINAGSVDDVVDIICTSMDLQFQKIGEKQIVINSN